MAEHEIKLSGRIKYENQPALTVDVKTTAVTLDEVLPVIDQFLKAMGFHYQGTLDITDDH